MTEPLTDAELDVLSGDIHRSNSHQVFCKGCGAEWPCLESRAVAELRELRQQNAALAAAHSECEAIIDSAETHAASWKAEYNKEFDKNAVLRADVARTLGWDSAEQWRAAMAQIDVVETSVKWFAGMDLAAALRA